MNTVQCSVCFGSGKTTCPGCGGTGRHTRLDGRGEMEISPCAVCGGSTKSTCTFCGGSGEIRTASVDPPPPGEKRDPNADPLEGRWQDQNGGWFEFKKSGSGYQVTTGGPAGTLGGGTATLSDKKVAIVISIPLLGNTTLEFQLSEGQLAGNINMMGMLVPAVFRPV